MPRHSAPISEVAHYLQWPSLDFGKRCESGEGLPASMPVTGWERLTAKSSNSFLTCLLLSSDSLTVLPTTSAASSPLVQTLPTHSASTSLLSDRLTPGMELCGVRSARVHSRNSRSAFSPVSAPRAADTLCSVEEESCLANGAVTVICWQPPFVILPDNPNPADTAAASKGSSQNRLQMSWSHICTFDKRRMFCLKGFLCSPVVLPSWVTVATCDCYCDYLYHCYCHSGYL